MSRRVSPLDNEQCRQCTSFSDYIKQNREKINAEVNDDEEMCVCNYVFLFDISPKWLRDLNSTETRRRSSIETFPRRLPT